MRVVAGIVLLAVGISSLLTGGCELVGGSAKSEAGELARALERDGRSIDADIRKQLAMAGASGTGLIVSGAVMALGGALSIVGAVLLLAGRARWLAFTAAGLGVVGELLYWILVAFYPLALIKIGLYVIAALAATAAAARPRRAAPALG